MDENENKEQTVYEKQKGAYTWILVDYPLQI